VPDAMTRTSYEFAVATGAELEGKIHRVDPKFAS
jgi:hypothetical protein